MVAAFKANLDHFVIDKTGNDEDEDEDEDEETADPCTQDETEDNLDHEINHEVEFSSLNRLACFSHTLRHESDRKTDSLVGKEIDQRLPH